MSYPPRPPGMMPGMPPPVSYGFPMGMMPMPPVMPPNMMGHMHMHKAMNKKLIPQEIPPPRKRPDDGEIKPVTTVFVGNISERAPDAMIKQMLQRCGNVLSWKRVQGASGKLQAFGFCEYDDPESTWRCIRLLNEWQITDKKLVVKVDAKTKDLLDEYKKKKKAKETGKKADSENGGEEGELEEESLDEFTMREDRVAKAGLDAIMREYYDDLTREPVTEEQQNRRQRKQKEEKDTGIDDMDMEDDKKDLINREIKFFRDSHKLDPSREVENDENNQHSTSSITSGTKDYRDRERERRRREEREREYDRERERRERERERLRRERSPSRSRSRDRSRERTNSVPKNRERRVKEAEEEEEMFERKKLERKLREKEMAYQERLKLWEARERKKARDYEKEKEKEEERLFEETKEGRRLKEFLEDYDDERDDPKFYKGSALTRRLKEREKEIEADTRDRQREKEEVEEIRRKLLEEGHPDPEGEVARIEDERNEHLRPRLKLEPEPLVSEPSKPIPDEEPEHIIEDEPLKEEPVEQPRLLPEGPLPMTGPLVDAESTSTDSPTEAPTRKKRLTVSEAFNQDDEEESETKRRKLTLPDSMESSKSDLSIKPPTTAEEKRKFIKTLIEQIPTGKEELFAYKLDWSMADQSLMDKRIKPWVNKKIVEYIGEEEATLVDFICQKVVAHSSPHNILDDVAMVLDEEAEVFVVKMWRLLIYETEAKKAGLVK